MQRLREKRACHNSFQKLLTGWCSWRTELEGRKQEPRGNSCTKAGWWCVPSAFDPEVDGAFSCFPAIDSPDPQLRVKSVEELTFRRTGTPAKTGETRPCVGAGGSSRTGPATGSPPPPPHRREWGERVHGATGPLGITGLPPTPVTQVRGLCETYSWGEGNRTHGTLLSWGLSGWILPSTPWQGQERTLRGEGATGWLLAHPPGLGEAAL